MNALIVGADKTPILEYAEGNFLFIDDGPLLQRVPIPVRKKVIYFDASEHHLNPLHEMDYVRAREFLAVMDAIFPEGENTLTRKNSNFVLLNALLEEVEEEDEPRYLDTLLKPDKKDPAAQDAYQKIATLMLSPVLRSVLCKPTNFSLKGIVLAHLDRAVLGDFDAFVLANLLISQFPGTVIVTDAGFYLREHHIALIPQNRLVAGVNFLDELSDKLRKAALLIREKVPSAALYDDAETLAKFAGERPDRLREDNEYNKFIAKAME